MKPSFVAGRAAIRRRRVVPFRRGFDRVGGFYGRFAVGAGKLGELKFHDVDLNDAVVSSTAAITETINIILQGVTESQRVGRKCTIRAVQWNYTWTLPVTAAATVGNGDVCRQILYLDKQANGDAAANSDILVLATDNQSFYNLANENRFVILMDKTISLNPLAAAGDGAANDTPQLVRYGHFSKKCNIPIEYSSTTGAIAEIRSNNLGVLLVTQNGVAGLTSKFRLRFSDN